MKFNIKGLVICLTLFIMSLVSSSIFADVQLTSGRYHTTVEDLKVKVLGGFVIMDRTWYEGRWQFNRRWNPLILQYDILDGSLKSIERNGDKYELKDPSKKVFRFGKDRVILVTADGLRWQDLQGNWINYDAAGRITSYGDVNSIRVSLVHDATGNLTEVRDHYDVQILWFEYDAAGKLASVRDSTNRRVQYHYTNDRLTQVIDLRGNEWRYQYDGQGRLKESIDAEGRRTTITYSSTGMVTSIKDQDGTGLTYSYDNDEIRKLFYVQVKTSGGRLDEYWYDRAGNLTRHDRNGRTISTTLFDGRKQIRTDSLGRQTLTEYDEWGLPRKIVYPDGSSVMYEYDTSYKPIHYTNENGVVTSREFDNRGHLVRLIEAMGSPVQRTTEYSYDGYGQRVSVKTLTDAVSSETVVSMAYDNWGNLQTVTDAEGYTVSYTFDVMGNILTRLDERGKIWKYTYDATGHLLSKTNPLNHVTRYEYDKVGNLISEFDPLNNITRYQYNAQNRRVKKIDPYNNSEASVYNQDGLLSARADEEGKVIRFEYDLDGRQTKTISSGGNTIAFEYEGKESNATDQQISTILYPTYSLRYQFDSRGRPIVKRQMLANNKILTITKSYDKVGNIIATSDELNRTSLIEYDLLNRRSIFTDPMGYTIKYFYDNRNNIISVVNQKNVMIRRLEYDRKNRKTKEVLAGGETFTFMYDGNDNLTKKIDGKGQVTLYTYDDANRLITESYFADNSATAPERTVHYTYDALFNLSGYDDGNTSGSYTYDVFRNKTSEAVNYGAFTLSYQYEYYKNGYKKAFVPASNSRIGYTYDLGNRLTQVELPGTGFIVIGNYRWFDAEQMIFPGGITQKFEHDSLMRKARITAKDPANNVLLDYVFTYDAVGNIVKKQTEHGDYLYNYDTMNRLAGVNNPLLASESYSYDPAGNRLTSNNQTDWIYNQNDQLIRYGDVVYQYDANGQLVQKTQADQVVRYFYDSAGRLVEIRNGDTIVVRYAYDPMGKRISKTVDGQTIYYFYSDEGLIGEYNNEGEPIRIYGYAPQNPWGAKPLFIKEGGNYAYYHNDHLGTPLKLSDNTGYAQWAAIYSAFGEAHIQRATITNNLRFSGQYYDAETGTHYNFFRDYNPELGRYIQVDPISLDKNINAYVYAGGNPLRNKDPLGLDTVGCDVVPDFFDTPCRLECCAGHDNCYDKYDCNANSWLKCHPFSTACGRCNTDAVFCFSDCGNSDYDDPNRPNYYCARLHKKVNIPGDFSDYDTAKQFCAS